MKKKKLTAAEKEELNAKAQKDADLKNDETRIVIPGLFTKREADVLKLLAKGTSRKNIGTELKIEITTVDKHINKIHLKTGTHSVAGLMLWIEDHKKSLREQGLID